ncbi:unnamed protein product [Symbiodinium sp. CCMP2592]|nr:unnamed protein product [Symbiodinium sp. CCMP2592]
MQAPPAWVMQTIARLPPSVQQRVQELLMRVMKDMFLPALATIPAVWAIAYVPHFLQLGLVLSKTGTRENTNREPRTTDLEQKGARTTDLEQKGSHRRSSRDREHGSRDPRTNDLEQTAAHRRSRDRESREPRAVEIEQTVAHRKLIQRCLACHVNALGSFPAFAAAVILCKLQKAKPMEAARLCYRYLFMRILYTAFYLGGNNNAVVGLRTLAWMDSTYCIARLYTTALSAAK